MPAFSSAQTTLLATGKFYAVDLIEIDFPSQYSNSSLLGTLMPSTTLYLNNSYGDIELTTDTGTNTYIGGKNGMMTTPSIIQNVDKSRMTINIQLSALNLFYVATIQESSYINAAVRIYKQLYDGEDILTKGALLAVGSPVKLFQGFIKGASYNVGNDNLCTFFCHHWLYDNKKTNTLQTNHESFRQWQERTGIDHNPNKEPFQNQGAENFKVKWGVK